MPWWGLQWTCSHTLPRCFFRQVHSNTLSFWLAITWKLSWLHISKFFLELYSILTALGKQLQNLLHQAYHRSESLQTQSSFLSLPFCRVFSQSFNQTSSKNCYCLHECSCLQLSVHLSLLNRAQMHCHQLLFCSFWWLFSLNQLDLEWESVLYNMLK